MKKIYSSFIVLVFILILGLSAHYYTFPDIRVSNTETVVIPGVEREYKFLFLTDMHMAIKSEQNLGEQLGVQITEWLHLSMQREHTLPYSLHSG